MYPEYMDNEGRPMTKHQRTALINRAYSGISDPEELDRRLAEIDSYDFNDASEALVQGFEFAA